MRTPFPLLHLATSLALVGVLMLAHSLGPLTPNAAAQRIGRFRAMDHDGDGAVTAEEFGVVCRFSSLGYFTSAAGSDGALTYDEYTAFLDDVRRGAAPAAGDWGRHFSCHP